MMSRRVLIALFLVITLAANSAVAQPAKPKTAPLNERIEKTAAAVKEILKKAAFNRDCLPKTEFNSGRVDPLVLYLEWERVRDELETTIMRSCALETRPNLELLFARLDDTRLEKFFLGNTKIDLERGARLRVKMFAFDDKIVQEVMKKALDVPEYFFLRGELRTMQIRGHEGARELDKKYRKEQDLDFAEVEKTMKELMQKDISNLLNKRLVAKESVKNRGKLQVLSGWVPSGTVESKQFEYFWRIELTVERVKGEEKWLGTTQVAIGRKSSDNSELVVLGETDRMGTSLHFKEAEKMRNVITEVPICVDLDDNRRPYFPMQFFLSPLSMVAHRASRDFTNRLTGQAK